MPDVLDMYGMLDDPWTGYRYRRQISPSPEPPPPQQEVFRYQDGQPEPIKPAAGDPYDPLREYTGVSDLQRGFKAAGEGDYLPAAGYGALGAAGMASMVPMGAFGMMAKSARRGGDALSALDAAITKARSSKELAMNAAEPRFPQYATSYPPLGPPIENSEMKINPKTGEEFEKRWFSRNMSPEGKAFMAERLRIKKDMDTYGYEPYFKPEDRFYVDPSNYPPANVDTSTLGPKKWDTISNYMTQIGAPETLAALRAAYQKGLDLGNADHWYAMGQMEAGMVKEFGAKTGRERFLDTFAVPMAATTSGNDPEANLMMAHYLEYLRQNNMPMPTHGSQVPAPMYGQRMTNNLEDYAAMRERGGYAGLGAGQPKMHNFSRSFVGDLSQPVMDDQMAAGMLAHAPGNMADNARTTAFGLLQAPLVTEAERMKIQPGNLQDVAWAGFRDQPGKPMISFVNDQIERTHRLTGMPREEIVQRGVYRKEIPLYGLLGALGLGGVAGEY